MTTTQTTTTHLPLDRLIENPANERKTFHDMEGLIETVRRVGIVEPLTVTPEADGHYRILTGHRRYRAAKAAGLDEVPVHIAADTHTSCHNSLVSNIQREDLPPLELAQALQSLLDEDDSIKNQRDLARVIGKSEVWVSNVLSLFKLPSTLKEKLWSTKFPISLDALVRIIRIKDSRRRKRLLEYLLTGATTQQIRAEIDAGQSPKTTTSERTPNNAWDGRPCPPSCATPRSPSASNSPARSSSYASLSSNPPTANADTTPPPNLHAPRIFKLPHATVAVAFTHLNPTHNDLVTALHKALRQARKP